MIYRAFIFSFNFSFLITIFFWVDFSVSMQVTLPMQQLQLKQYDGAQETQDNKKYTWDWDLLNWTSDENRTIWESLLLEKRETLYNGFMHAFLCNYLLRDVSAELNVSIHEKVFVVENEPVIDFIKAVKLFSCINKATYNFFKAKYISYMDKVFKNSKKTIGFLWNISLESCFFNLNSDRNIMVLADFIAYAEKKYQGQRCFKLQDNYAWECPYIDGNIRINAPEKNSDNHIKQRKRLVYLFKRIFYFQENNVVGYMAYVNEKGHWLTMSNIEYFFQNGFEVFIGEYLTHYTDRNIVRRRFIVKPLAATFVKKDDGVIEKRLTLNHSDTRIAISKCIQCNENDELKKEIQYLKEVNELQKNVLQRNHNTSDRAYIMALNAWAKWPLTKEKQHAAKITEFNKEIKTLQENMQLAESAKSFAEERLKSTIRPLNEKIERLNNLIKERGTQLNEVKKERDLLELQVAEIEQLKSAQQESLKNAQEKSNEILKMSQQIKKLEEEKQILEVKGIQFQSKVTEIENSAKNRLEEIQSTQEKLFKMQNKLSELETAKADLTAAKGRADTLAERVDELETSLQKKHFRLFVGGAASSAVLLLLLYCAFFAYLQKAPLTH